SYKDECFDKIGLHPSEKMKMINGSLDCEYRCYDIFEGKNKDYKKALNEQGGEDAPAAPRLKTEFPKKEYGSHGDNRPSARPNFKSDRLDRPERRFAAAHSEDEDERASTAPGKRFFGEERKDGRPSRKEFGGERPVRPILHKAGEKRPVKMRYRDDDDNSSKNRKSFGDRKRSEGRPFKKPFKRGSDEFED
ncbi:MAG: hypothetical protein LUG65_00250, partial [Clostridiales bacterium]|nr:hypothetical protein [Clostridiales bacterium]